MLSATADHALRAVLFLARQSGHHRTPAEEIARAIGAPGNYLSKILHALRKRGVVASSAGFGGGFALAVDPTRLTLIEVVGDFESGTTMSRCLLGDRPCNPTVPCAAHRRWSAIREAHQTAMATTTIADLLSGDISNRQEVNTDAGGGHR